MSIPTYTLTLIYIDQRKIRVSLETDIFRKPKAEGQREKAMRVF